MIPFVSLFINYGTITSQWLPLRLNQPFSLAADTLWQPGKGHKSTSPWLLCITLSRQNRLRTSLLQWQAVVSFLFVNFRKLHYFLSINTFFVPAISASGYQIGFQHVVWRWKCLILLLTFFRPELLIVAFVLSFGLMIGLMFKRKEHPTNMYLLLAFVSLLLSWNNAIIIIYNYCIHV